MSFLRHLPCPKCNSKDNLGEYDDHYFCFGCKYYHAKDDVFSLRKRINNQHKKQSTETEMLINVKDIPQKAMKWLLKYGITPDEIKKYKFSWNPIRNMLVLLETKDYWQGRNFGFGPKYQSNGNKPLTIYGNGDIIVLVEDVLSAVKIARLRNEFCSLPLLGSSVSKQVEHRLVKLNKPVYVWLDRDKAVQAVRIKNRLKSLGLNSKVIVTNLDPKEYNKSELIVWLKSR